MTILQLTAEELGTLFPPSELSEGDALQRFFAIWTLKEAYTKAIGIGLGFDFKRISYDVVNGTVHIDGVAPEGWEFIRFDLTLQGAVETTSYVGFAARYAPGKVDGHGLIVLAEQRNEWLEMSTARDFLQRAIDELRAA